FRVTTMPSSSTYAALLTIVLLVCLSAAQNSENYPSLAKRGGARAFHGYFNMPSSKRLSGEYPYYLYEKRGGGRAFFGGWQPYESLGARMDRRGGGRAFSGWLGPNEYYRFYENPYYKRSSSLWEFLEDRNAL
uniref:Neuropeptide-Like Protein n=1 Tax=Haemonchus contortus TaxID=6289 RepID=A0A7I4YRE9_HAECO